MVFEEEGMGKTLPLPGMDCGIIAGGRNNQRGYNPLLPGDDDGVVTVKSAQLENQSDFVLVRCLHSFLPLHHQVIEYSNRFLLSGRFHET